MGLVHIERVWDGDLEPIQVTLSGTTYQIGLVEADWQQPSAQVCADLTTEIKSATGENTWAITRSATTGAVTIACGKAFDLALATGFASYWGFSSTTYEGITTVTSTTPLYQIRDQRVSFGLPVRTWTRSLEAHMPVCWSDGTDFSFDVTWTHNHFDSLNFDPRRHTCVVAQGATPWALDNRSGYVVLRPLVESVSREALGQSVDWGRYSFRCTWINQTIEV